MVLEAAYERQPVTMNSTSSLDLLRIDAKTLQALLSNGSVSSVDITEAYTTQISKHDGYLHAMLSRPSHDKLIKVAKALDAERKSGQIRSPLHGIPVIIKENIATLPSLEMKSSAGSLALLSSVPKENARVVDLLIAAGAIILGKTNLTELSNFMGTSTSSGLSAVGGQTQSAYVRGGVKKDGEDGHSNPSGSSSGSAVGVSAGYAPLSLGTETSGSLVVPAGRAALYTVKPTIGLVSQSGIVPVSHTFDSAGPMTKSVHDLAVALDILVENRPPGQSYVEALSGSWRELSVGTLDPEKWKLPEDWMFPVEEATVQMVSEIKSAYAKIKGLAKTYVEKVSLVDHSEVQYKGKDSKVMVTETDFHHDLNKYLLNLEYSEVRSLGELIEFNKTHKERELPPGVNQKLLEDSYELALTPQQYEENMNHCRKFARDKGIDKTLQDNNIDVIIGPGDSLMFDYAACAGYPVAAMPLSYLKYNGRPFGLAVITKAHQESVLIKVLSAWEANFSPRHIPPSLQENLSKL